MGGHRDPAIAGATLEALGVQLPAEPLDAQTVAAIIRITGGNLLLLNGLLTNRQRSNGYWKINALQQGTKTVVEAARESLVIGQV